MKSIWQRRSITVVLVVWGIWGFVATILLIGGFSGSDTPPDIPVDSVVTATPASTEEARIHEIYYKFYEQGGPFISHSLNCPADMEIRGGPTWRDITIGETSYSALEEIYGVFALEVFSNLEGDFAHSYSIRLTENTAREKQLPMQATMCVVSGKIMVLALSVGDLNDPLFPSISLMDWVSEYGVPDIVTWSFDGGWAYRTVIWSDQGIAAKVRILNDVGLVQTVVLFPYAQSPDELSKWPYTELPGEPVSPNEGYPTEENPFDFS